MHRLFIASLASFAVCTSVAVADSNLEKKKRPQKKMLSERAGAYSPEKQLESFKLADGFVIELVASEKHGLINPIDLTFDDAGRLWTQTAEMYPLDPVTGINFGKALKMMRDPNLDEKYPRVSKIRDLYELKKRGKDKILIMGNPTKMATKPLHVWADGLAIPQSIFPYKDGCFVAHGSEFFFMRDTDGDYKQDEVESVMSGFGFFDTHTMAHSIVRGPGGWLNFTHGALNSGNVTLKKNGKQVPISYAKNLRYSLDGENLEVVSTARDNVWGYQLRANGQWYATSANDNGLSVHPVEDQTGIDGIGGDKIRSYQPLIKSVHDFRVGGTGISGLAFSEDGANGFPAEWEDVAFLANPITNAVNCVRIKRLASGEIKAELLPDLLSCSDEWFRPVNLEMGPDGCLYIADWYNKIVSHNEVSTDHPDRDRKHGRIWRIRHESQKPFKIPDLIKAKSSRLVQHISKGRTLWEKRAAWHQIVDRQAKELAPELISIVKSSELKEDVIIALWCLEGLKHFDQEVMKATLASSDGDIRREAIRSLASYDLPVETIAALLKPYLNDSNAMVRSQLLRTLEEVKTANLDTISYLVGASKPAGEGKTYGNGYEAHFERFLARKALEAYPDELVAYLSSERASEHPSSHLLWAIQALPEKTRLNFFIDSLKKNEGELDGNTFVSLCEMLHHPQIKEIAAPAFENRREEMLKLTLENKDSVNLARVSTFFSKHIESLLKSEDGFAEGLGLVNKLYSPHHSQAIEKHPEEKTKILVALGNDPKVSKEVYSRFFEEEGFSLKLNALSALFLKDPKDAAQKLAKWLPQLSETQVPQVVKRLSYTKKGAAAVKALTIGKAIPQSAWDYDSAQRSLSYATKENHGLAIYDAALKKEEAENAARKEKVLAYAEAVRKLEGNPETGKGLFQVCLSCHQVGNQGVYVGPPLDGSANRDLTHLITAIVNPDEAVEGAYGLYTVVKKDGSVVEAMLKSQSKHGTTMVSAGGFKTFIPQFLILSEGGVSGRSFMPVSFGGFPDQTMADLLSYIETLK